MNEYPVGRENYFNGKILRIKIVTKRCYSSTNTRIKRVALLIIFYFVYNMDMQNDVNSFKGPEEDTGPECAIPYLDLFSDEVPKHKPIPDIVCDGEDWVKCYHSKCKVVANRLAIMKDITCTYNDIIHKSDKKYVFGPPVHVKNDGVYTLIDSDHVKVSCTGYYYNGEVWNWTYYCTGFRDYVEQYPPRGRENTLNVLILMFDSTSRKDFIRNLPKTYKYLVESLNATVLQGYNIVGDGTAGSLFPILSGSTEYELPNVRKNSLNNRTLDSLPFIFYKLKEDGYRTAYLEDMPWVGTFQYKYNGFRQQPTDHYLRSFFIEEAYVNQRKWLSKDSDRFCVGDTPQYKLMLNITEQFLLLDGKKFCLTMISDLTHDNLNMLSLADNALLQFLQRLSEHDQLRNTLLFVMADHGKRYGKIRKTFQGRLEERLPFVSIVLPEELKHSRPDVQAALGINANRWTTPFDVHTTILDALDLPQHMNQYKVPGANIPRAMSFLQPIPQNRSCWDAGIDPHWCTCLAWKNLTTDNAFYQKAANKVMRYINLLTDVVRHKCAIRSIIAIDWVRRQEANKQMVASRKGIVRMPKQNYQVRVVLGPGNATYEASMTYEDKSKRFLLEARHISRVNAYGNESKCISSDRPHLSSFCFCVNK